MAYGNSIPPLRRVRVFCAHFHPFQRVRGPYTLFPVSPDSLSLGQLRPFHLVPAPAGRVWDNYTLLEVIPCLFILLALARSLVWATCVHFLPLPVSFGVMSPYPIPAPDFFPVPQIFSGSRLSPARSSVSSGSKKLKILSPPPRRATVRSAGAKKFHLRRKAAMHIA